MHAACVCACVRVCVCACVRAYVLYVHVNVPFCVGGGYHACVLPLGIEILHGHVRMLCAPLQAEEWDEYGAVLGKEDLGDAQAQGQGADGAATSRAGGDAMDTDGGGEGAGPANVAGKHPGHCLEWRPTRAVWLPFPPSAAAAARAWRHAWRLLRLLVLSARLLIWWLYAINASHCLAVQAAVLRGLLACSSRVLDQAVEHSHSPNLLRTLTALCCAADEVEEAPTKLVVREVELEVHAALRWVCAGMGEGGGSTTAQWCANCHQCQQDFYVAATGHFSTLLGERPAHHQQCTRHTLCGAAGRRMFYLQVL